MVAPFYIMRRYDDKLGRLCCPSLERVESREEAAHARQHPERSCVLARQRTTARRYLLRTVVGAPRSAYRQGRLAQTRARVHPQVHPAAERVPLRRDRDRLADDVQVPPAPGQAALALERRAATVPVPQVHRLARVVGGVDGGHPAAGPLLEGDLLERGCPLLPSPWDDAWRETAYIA